VAVIPSTWESAIFYLSLAMKPYMAVRHWDYSKGKVPAWLLLCWIQRLTGLRCPGQLRKRDATLSNGPKACNRIRFKLFDSEFRWYVVLTLEERLWDRGYMWSVLLLGVTELISQIPHSSFTVLFRLFLLWLMISRWNLSFIFATMSE
jgi:hypothetical protein